MRQAKLGGLLSSKHLLLDGFKEKAMQEVSTQFYLTNRQAHKPLFSIFALLKGRESTFVTGQNTINQNAHIEHNSLHVNTNARIPPQHVGS